MFGKETGLPGGRQTVAVKSVVERKKFVLGAFNAGEGRIAGAQQLAEQAGKNPRLWSDVQHFIALAGTTPAKERETKEYVEGAVHDEAEFAIKSPADKRKKHKKPGRRQTWRTEGHWRTIDDRPVFICARSA